MSCPRDGRSTPQTAMTTTTRGCQTRLLPSSTTTTTTPLPRRPTPTTSLSSNAETFFCQGTTPPSNRLPVLCLRISDITSSKGSLVSLLCRLRILYLKCLVLCLPALLLCVFPLRQRRLLFPHTVDRSHRSGNKARYKSLRVPNGGSIT